MKNSNPHFADYFRSQEAIVFVITVMIFGSFSIFLEGFFDVENLLTLVRSVSVLGILSVAMAIVVISRGIDLSLVGVLVVSTALAVILTSPNPVFQNGLSFNWSVLIGLLFVIIASSITGTLIAFGNLPAVFVSLAMGSVIYGMGLTFFIKTNANYLPVDAQWVMFLGSGRLLGVPMPIISFIILLSIFSFILNKTAFGQFLYAIGDNTNAARTAGIPVRPIIIVVYIMAGIIAYVAGLLTAGAVTNINTKLFQSTLIYDVLLVVVVGGIGLSGGKGGMRNVLLGTVLIGTLLNGMVILNMSFIQQNLIKGLILLVAIMVDTILNPRDEQTSQQGDI
ncbi:MAG: ribose transport system permease protein [Parvicella sp.]|jgi:ribose transport system permease protein